MPLPPTSTTAPDEQAPAEAVTPLIRGLAVVRTLTDADGALGISDLKRSTGLARSTLDRITGTLARMGHLRFDGPTVLLAPRLMEIGNAYLAALRLPDLLGPSAHRLACELDESVSLAVPDGDGIRFIHQTTRRRALSVSFRIGDLLPVERTAAGPLIAAGWNRQDWARWHRRRAADPLGRGFAALPPRGAEEVPTDAEFTAWAKQAGERGWALDDQLIEPGLIALAVPVHAPDGGIACLASLVSHTSRHSAEELADRLLPRLRAAVAAMERRLREAPPGPAAQPCSGLASWTSASKHELGGGFVESLARGLTVFAAFGPGRAELTLAAVARATGLARATARRALITLAHLGYVASRDGAFHLTPRVLALGYPPLSHLTLPRIARPHLAALTEQVDDSASLAVLDGDEVRYTARVARRRIMSVEIAAGTRLPAYATSMGRVLLADLPTAERAARLERAVPRALASQSVTTRAELPALLDRAADQGYALVDQELEDGLRSIAVPVRDREGRTVAAVNVAMHASRRSTEQCLTEVLPRLRTTAAAIAADLSTASRFCRIPET